MDMYFFYETEIFDEKIDFQSEEIPKNLASRIVVINWYNFHPALANV